MMTPFQHQVTGAAFLAESGAAALLADEPRVGKTGAAEHGDTHDCRPYLPSGSAM